MCYAVYIFGHFLQILLNKFFDTSIPSMRKVDNGGKDNKSQPPVEQGVGHQHQHPKIDLVDAVKI